MALLTIRSLPATAHPPRKSSSADPPCGGRRHLLTQIAELGIVLVEDAEVSTPELVVLHGAQLRPGREALRETGDVVDLELLPRQGGRVTTLRVAQHVRQREVVVRTVDQRDVPVEQGRRRVEDVRDPDRLGGDATRLEGDLLLLEGSAGDAQAQAAVHAVRRVLDLERRVVDRDSGLTVAVREGD